ASLWQTTRWQFAHERAFVPYAQPASAIRGFLSSEWLDRGVVIGPERGNLTYVLFRLRSRSRVLLLPAGSVVDAATVGNGIAWVLIAGSYDVRLEGGHVAVQTDRLT